MKALVAIVTLNLILFTSYVQSQVMTLECVTDAGSSFGSLEIDLSKKTMQMRDTKYEIYNIDDNYISASHIDGQSGELWMINRNTGVYKRVGIMGCTSNCVNSDLKKKVILANVYAGVCLRRQI